MKDIFHFSKIEKDGQVLNIIKPKDSYANLDYLVKFIEIDKEYINNLLLKSGAILFRGFNISSQKDFLVIRNTLTSDYSFEYIDGNSPRKILSKGIYTSTEFPKDQTITIHNELSYSSNWPSRLYFFCESPSIHGGETPIVDCRYILKILNQEIIKLFDTLNVKYTRFLHDGHGLGKSWIDTFQTSSKVEVENYCKKHKFDFFWEGQSLYISQIGLGIATHPITREKVWFNQANQFHPSSLQEDVYDAMKLLFSGNTYKYPHYAYFGNGQEIQEDYLFQITSAFEQSSIKFKWEKGDFLYLDNMLMAHGRMPYIGERKILVSMS